MLKKITLVLVVIVSLPLLSSCGKIVGGVLVTEEKRAEARMEQIILAIEGNDKESLRSLFSKKAIEEASDFDNGTISLLDFIQGDIKSCERNSWASDESIEYGKRSLMIRSSYKIKTDEEEYFFFVVDYNVDTIDPDNEGIYMLQVRTSGYNEYLGSWQERLRAGFYIPEKEK